MQFLDENNAAVTFMVTASFQVAFLLITWLGQIEKVTDVAVGINFSLIAVLTLCLAETYLVRQLVLSGLVCLWSLRLSSYLVFRTLTVGEDDRFQKRDGCTQFLGFWTFQGVWAFIVSLPVIFVNSPTTAWKSGADTWGHPCDIIGVIIFTLGLLCETFADMQKFYYKDNPHNQGRWCTFGLWRWSRHPNYFGEMLVWWGVFAMAAPTLTKLQWFAVISPLVTMAILLFLSGILLMEHKADNKYGMMEDYILYKKNTSVLVPVPPCIFTRLPHTVKQVLFFEYPMYNFLDRAGHDETANITTNVIADGDT